jgi:hypothetical protein
MEGFSKDSKFHQKKLLHEIKRESEESEEYI